LPGRGQESEREISNNAGWLYETIFVFTDCGSLGQRLRHEGPLIYDASGKRVKAVKHSGGHYSC
jgi:hypothetical protein